MTQTASRPKCLAGGGPLERRVRPHHSAKAALSTQPDCSTVVFTVEGGKILRYLATSEIGSASHHSRQGRHYAREHHCNRVQLRFESLTAD